MPGGGPGGLNSVMASLFQKEKLNRDEKQLMGQLMACMSAPPKSPAEAQKKGENIRKQLVELSEKDKIASSLRLMGVQFLVMYHTMAAMELGQSLQKAGTTSLQDDKVVKFRTEQYDDMEACWRLLSWKPDSKEITEAALLLKVDVAQRLESSEKLRQVFDGMLGDDPDKKIPTLSMQTAMVAFTAAPMLGDWRNFVKIGEKLLAKMGNLEIFHGMAQQMPVPDYEVIHTMAVAANLKDLETPTPDQLPWEQYDVENIRVKFRDVKCEGFEQKENEIRAEIKKQNEDDKWEDVPNVETITIKRMGGVVQTMSFGEVPMQVAGPWQDTHMHVKGYTEIMMTGKEMTPQEQQMIQMQLMQGMIKPEDLPMIRQCEEWELERSTDNPAIWTGVYTLDQTPILSKEDREKMTDDKAPIKMTFDCEMTIKKVDASLQSLVAKRGAASASTGATDDEKTNAEEPIVTSIDGLTLD